jgi:hypothetical protein
LSLVSRVDFYREVFRRMFYMNFSFPLC